MPKLTTETVRKTKPKDKEFFIWDSRLPGFGLRIKPNGTKSFVIQYRDNRGKSKRATLGQFGKPLTADEAFKAAREKLAEVTLGGDPVSEARSRRETLTIQEFCERYISDAEAGRVRTRRRTPKSASTLATDRGRIRSHIVPLLGAKLLTDITRHDVRGFLDNVAAGKTAHNSKTEALRGRSIVTGGTGTAKRTVGLLQGILTHAVDLGYIETNPALGMRLPADGKRRLTNLKETYSALGRATRLAGKNGEHWQAVYLTRLISITGLRRGEAVSLEWDAVDNLRHGLDLQHTKTGASFRPVAESALDLLSQLRKLHNHTRFVFPAVRSQDAHYGSFPNAWNRICTQTELSPRERELLGNVSPHKLRHAFATTGNRLKYSEMTIGGLLGHRSHGVTEGYISMMREDLVNAANMIALEIVQLMNEEISGVEEGSDTASDNILTFRRN